MTKTEKVILGLLEHARPAILEHFRIDSCIASSRIALSVFEEFKVPAFELPVQTTVVNAVFRQFLIDHKRWPGTSEIKELIDEGAYSVGIGFGLTKHGPEDEAVPSSSDKWDGHLVVVAKDEEKNCHYLVDLSIDQASRPNHGMPIKPLAWPVDESFAQDADVTVIDLTQDSEFVCSVFYYSTPNKERYKESSNWDKESTMFIVNEIVNKINKSTNLE